MAINLSEDIRSVTDLKRKTKEILNQVHRTKRPVVLTVNGKAGAVLMDTTTYEKQLKAANMAALVTRAEQDIASGHTRSMRSFLKEFKRARKTPR
jgi:prevent-host-death family protein